MTTLNNEIVLQYLLSHGLINTASAMQEEVRSLATSTLSASAGHEMDIQTKIIAYNPCENDPHGSTNMPIYQTATFKQPGATDFGEYDYSRSGNPTRDALQNLVADLEGVANAKAFAFSTGMAAINAVIRVAAAGDEVLINDDSYGGTYRLMSNIATRHGILIKYINLAGRDGPSVLRENISSKTKLVMIESPTNPMQRICDIQKLADICRSNNHPTKTFLSIDNTMMSPILSRPLEHGADIVIHSATKFMAGHADTMAGVVIVRDVMVPGSNGQEDKSLAKTIYFYQNAEGTGLAPFDCWLVLRGIRTMNLRVLHQQNSAFLIAKWLKTLPQITSVIYCGFPDHPDYDIHSSQSSGSGCVVCFTTGNFELSKHIVTVTKLFKITVSFGSVSSVISVPGQMSHASIPPEVRSVREFPEDLIRMSIGIESPKDLILDLEQAINSFKK